MEDSSVRQELLTVDKQVRLSYHAPELISLGQIESVVRTGAGSACDAVGGTNACS
jgi:hypothetical protein